VAGATPATLLARPGHRVLIERILAEAGPALSAAA
jgi:hypothetical protein